MRQELLESEAVDRCTYKKKDATDNRRDRQRDKECRRTEWLKAFTRQTDGHLNRIKMRREKRRRLGDGKIGRKKKEDAIGG